MRKIFDEKKSATKSDVFLLLQKIKPILFFIFATIFLILSVAALVIVFAVEHSWFTDSFRPNSTKISNTNYTNQYGLWRLCFYANQTCESWFLTEGVNALYIDERLNQGRSKRKKIF